MTRQLSILVVDDDVDNAMSLGELFALEGHKVQLAHSGQDAIDAYSDASFDLAFMDVMMPGKNGVESFMEIRRLRPQARVFMMTGYSVEELLGQAVREGAMGYLEKPFDPAEVLRLTESIGSGGLLVALPDAPKQGVGHVIEAALRNNGRTCWRLEAAAALNGRPPGDDVVIIDAPMPLIDAVSSFEDLRRAGHTSPTIIVPHSAGDSNCPDGILRDVGVTGILNKPFDPLDLINRLPQLAA